MTRELVRKLVVLAVVACGSYFFALACSGGDGPDPDAGDTAIGPQPDMPTNNPPNNGEPDMETPPSDMGGGGGDDMGGGGDDMGGGGDDMGGGGDDMGGGGDDMGGIADPWRYLRLEDTDGSTTDTTEHVAADIDAIALTDLAMNVVYADAPVSNGADAAYPEGLAGPQTDPVCVQGAFISLGVEGPLIVSFDSAAEIVEGATVTVYEVDSTICAPSGPDSDSYLVSVGTSSDPAGEWIELGVCQEGQPCEFTIPVQ